MSAQISSPSPPPALPEGVVSGSRKRKQAFSLNDPDNVELQRLAAQAAKKKQKLKKVLASSDKEKSYRKPILQANRQPSIEEVDDVDNDQQPMTRVFPRNPKTVIETDDEDNGANVTTQTARKKVKLSKLPLIPKKKKRGKPAPKPNHKPAVIDVDDPMDVDTDDNEGDEEDTGDETAESAEAELGQ